MTMMLNDDYVFWATRPPTCPTWLRASSSVAI